MKTLSKVSSDRLVIIVTHNYEQVEPYVTRKLTMNDGRLIEDRRFDRVMPPQADLNPQEGAVIESQIEENQSENMDFSMQLDRVPEELRREFKHEKKAEENKASSETHRARKQDTSRNQAYEDLDGRNQNLPLSGEVRLGLRNTFNLPIKFILLLLVYTFVVVAVIGQYTSMKNKLHQGDILGANGYFANTQAERILITKNDRSLFTAEDFEKLKDTPNVSNIIKDDISVDKGVEVAIDDAYLDGGFYPVDMISKVDVGRLPQNDNEIVLAVGDLSMAKNTLKELGDKAIGKAVTISDITNTDVKLAAGGATIVGIVWNSSQAPSSMAFGSDRVYGSEALGKEIATKLNASASTTTITYGNVAGNPSTGSQTVIPSSNVPEGQAYIFDEKQANYDNGAAKGKGVTVSVKNTYYTQDIWLKVADVITQDNIAKKLGISKDDYATYSSYLYVNPSDYAALYQRDSYQVTIMTEDETEAGATVANLKADGFKPLQLKDTLTDISGGFSFVIKLISFAGLIIEMVVLFFIAYAVIRLVMRSRNSYYSTLRILGASKKNTNRILNVELFVIMTIACALNFVAMVLIKYDVIHSKALVEQLSFLRPSDCLVLLVLLLGTSLLIGNRYSKKIFESSAMKSYREVV